MKKKLVSLILVLLLCVTLAPAAIASTTTENNAVSINKGASVVITANKDLYYWGQNQTTPQKILSNVEFAMTNGIPKLGLTVAITTNKDLYVWGNNQYGQIGNGISGGG